MDETQGILGIFTTDRDLTIRTWDDGMVEATQISGPAARGRRLTDLFPEIAERGLLDRFRRVLDEGVVETLAPVFHHYLIACPPREPSEFFDRMQQRVTIAPLRQDEAAIVGTIVTVEDVTRRRERDKRLAEELKHPEEARRLKAAETLASGEDVDRLVEVMGDESWRVRRAAVDGLSRRMRMDTVRNLLKTLQTEHNNLSVLNSALQILSLSEMDTLTPLIEFLRDPEVELRICSALLLGEKRDVRAVPALLAALDDPDPNVRYHAVEALGKLRDPAAADKLLDVAETKDFFLAFPALDALARIGDPRSASRIVPFLADPLLCAPAASALGQIGDESAIPPLAGLLQNPDSPAAVIAQAMAVIHERYEQRYREGAYIAETARRNLSAPAVQHLIDTLPEATEEELRFLTVVLGWLTGPAVERAMTRLLGNPAVRAEVVTALTQYGKRVVDLVVEQLQTDDLETRKAALIALGRIGDASAVPALSKLLDDDDELVVIAAGALAKIGDRQAFEALLKLLGHANTTVRQAAIGALNSIGHPDMGAKMEELLVHADPLIRESAVRIAGYFGYERCIRLLLERAGDAEENVRRSAVEHLAYLDHAEVLPVLCRTVRKDTPRVRAAAAKALADFESPEARNALLAALSDSDSWVRYFAARSVGKQRCTEAMEALSRLVKEDKAAHVRIAAVKALGMIGDPEAVSVLMDVADSPEEDLAVTALSALGRMEDAKAREKLLKTLRSSSAALRLGAVKGLGQRCDESVINTLQWVAAAEEEEEVALASIEALAAAGTPEAVSSLIDLTLESSRREAAVEALSGLGDEQLAAMAAGFSAHQTEARLAVIDVLLRMKRPAATEILTQALGDREEKVRIRAIQALARLGSRRAEKDLYRMVSKDSSPEVRREARKALEGM